MLNSWFLALAGLTIRDEDSSFISKKLPNSSEVSGSSSFSSSLGVPSRASVSTVIGKTSSRLFQASFKMLLELRTTVTDQSLRNAKRLNP